MPLRSDPEKVRAWQRRSRANLARSSRLRQQSPSKAARRSAVQAARLVAFARDGNRCQAVDLLPAICCAGMLEGHHIAPRSTAPSRTASPSNIIGLCSAHHTYVTDHPAEANKLGLHAFTGDTLAELALRRRIAL